MAFPKCTRVGCSSLSAGCDAALCARLFTDPSAGPRSLHEPRWERSSPDGNVWQRQPCRNAVQKAGLHRCQGTGLHELTGLGFYLQKQISNLVFCFTTTCFFSKRVPSWLIWKVMAPKYLIIKMQFAKNTAGLVQKMWSKKKNPPWLLSLLFSKPGCSGSQWQSGITPSDRCYPRSRKNTWAARLSHSRH